MFRIVVTCCALVLLSLYGPAPADGGESPVAHARLDEGTRVKGGTTVLGRTADTVYVVDRGRLRPVTSDAYAKLWSGFDGILTVGAVVEDAIGEPLEAGTRLVAVRGGTELWLIDGARFRRRVRSFTAILAWRFDLRLVEEIDRPVLEAFPEGAPVSGPDPRDEPGQPEGPTWKGVTYEEWCDRLFSPDPATVLGAGGPLFAFGPHAPETLRRFTTAIGSDGPETRGSAAPYAFAAGVKAVPLLVAALGDETDTLRFHAAFCLRKIGPAAAPAVPALVAMAGDDEESSRWAAMDALAAIGPAHPDAIPALASLLGDEDLWSNAVEDLIWVGPPALDAVRPGLGDDASRGPALLVLDAIAPDEPGVIDGLVSLLESDDEQLALAATRRLEAREDLPPAASLALRDRGKHPPDPMIRGYTPRTLRATGGGSTVPASREPTLLERIREGCEAGRVAPALKAALSDPNWEVRIAGVQALRHVEPFAAAADALLPAVRDRDRFIREETLRTLVKMGPTATPLLRRLLRSSEPEIRWRAARCLEALAKRDESALAAVLALVEDPDPEIAAIALRARWAADRRGSPDKSGR